MHRPSDIHPGQRWASDAEPELGLGRVAEIGEGRISIEFPAAETHRLYALGHAPIRRVRFHPGDSIESRGGARAPIESVEERDGLLLYHTAAGVVPESELSDRIPLSHPGERLLSGQMDDLAAHARRVAAVTQRNRLQTSPVRGFIGSRIDLLPHQIAIADEVSGRRLPRVLLADEVGLGKTIEACLILHRLQLTGRAGRVLILVPEPLLHQWFVELYRRFNLTFSLYDESRYTALKREGADNPFEDSQQVLCSVSFLLEAPERLADVLATPWDLLIVDEAHHLEWTPEAASPAYAAVEALAEKTPGILLLTATPEQLGAEGHFARLRLLDPDRYDCLEAFQEEGKRYGALAELVEALAHLEQAGAPLEKARPLLEKGAKHLPGFAAAEACEEHSSIAELIDRVVDAFGPGRVWFRNSRSDLSGFPERQPHFIPLTAEVERDATALRLTWLVEFLREMKDEKVLLITHSRAAAEQLAEDLQRQINLSTGVFHEGLSLLQRDRNAAWFAEADGAQLLICSEIGSEGRNFQFCHHLVLFDLPTEPELLEQRIGRLDRIGQHETIHLHVPYLPGTREAAWVRWYDEGLDAFRCSLPGGHELGQRFAARLAALGETPEADAVDTLVAETRRVRDRLVADLQRGRGRLLALRPQARKRASEVIRLIEKEDADSVFETWVIRLLDHLGVAIEDLAPHRYHFAPGIRQEAPLPGLPADGRSFTFDRTEALQREDLGFLTGDHPLIEAALDQLMSTEAGNVTFALGHGAGREGLTLQAWFSVECPAPAALHVERFLPGEPVTLEIDHEGRVAPLAPLQGLVDADPRPLYEREVVRRKILPRMIEKLNEAASTELAAQLKKKTRLMHRELKAERSRLELLQARHQHVRPEEITALEDEETALATALAQAQPRLEALRLIWFQS